MKYFILALFLSVVTSETFSTSGTDFISYHVYGDPTSSACYPDKYQSNWAGYITANIYNLPCGACVRMTSGSKTIYVYAIDIGGRGFDLNLPAFCELCGDAGGFARGGCDVTWQVMPDTSACAAFIAGKTKPDCNLCPTGHICGNPDPARNGGVPWHTYCPSVVPLGSVSMTRCEMRIDGCTCYPPTGTPVKAPVPPPPVLPPVKVPVVSPVESPVESPDESPDESPVESPVKSKGVTTTRCGLSWTAANTQCNADCRNPEHCPSGHNCYADLSMKPCFPNAITESSTLSTTGASTLDGTTLIGIIVGVCGVIGLTIVAAAVVYYFKPVKEEIV